MTLLHFVAEFVRWTLFCIVHPRLVQESQLLPGPFPREPRRYGI